MAYDFELIKEFNANYTHLDMFLKTQVAWEGITKEEQGSFIVRYIVRLAPQGTSITIYP